MWGRRDDNMAALVRGGRGGGRGARCTIRRGATVTSPPALPHGPHRSLTRTLLIENNGKKGRGDDDRRRRDDDATARPDDGAGAWGRHSRCSPQLPHSRCRSRCLDNLAAEVPRCRSLQHEVPSCPAALTQRPPKSLTCLTASWKRMGGQRGGTMRRRGDDEAETRRCGDEQRRRRGDAMRGRRTTRRALAGRAGPTTRRRGEDTTMRTAVRIEPGRMT